MWLMYQLRRPAHARTNSRPLVLSSYPIQFNFVNNIVDNFLCYNYSMPMHRGKYIDREKYNEYFREYRRRRRRHLRKYNRLYNKKWRQINGYEKRKRYEYAEHTKAWRIVTKAIRSGKIKRGKCEKCKRRDTHAHHDDYSKPLSVRWLCPFHHAQHHLKLRNA